MIERPIKRVSLAGQLFRRMIILLASIVLVVCGMMFFTADDQINTAYDGQLITGANVLRALMTDEIKEHSAGSAASEPMEIGDEWLSAEDRKAFDAYADWRMFRIWKDGKTILASDTGPAMAPPPNDAKGFRMVGAGGDTWRIFSLPLPEANAVVQVGERVSIRSSFVNHILLELAVPLILVIPASAALIWLSLGDGLQALRGLVKEISRRGSHDLAPLETGVWPADLEPLVLSVNDVMRRLQESHLQERRFIDNAAHQLRTPLAALSLQAQLIANEEDPAEREQLVLQLRAGVARAVELTEQLLTLARLGAEDRQHLALDLRAEAGTILSEHALVAAARQVSLALEGDAPLTTGDPALLRLILSNLIENAVSHAPPESEVQVTLSGDEQRCYVVVSDRGQGIAPAERERVFERFFRGERAGGVGSGLGLSIVEEAASLLGASVSLNGRADGGPGLEARVVLSATPG